MNSYSLQPRPPWLRRRYSAEKEEETIRVLRQSRLNTVCEEADCPNRSECFARNTATFLILGDRCTRDCRFCAVRHGFGAPSDIEEPERVALAARKLNLQYVVVTSVTRDDLPDGGSRQFSKTIAALRREIPGIRVEILVPDFQGCSKSIATVIGAGPDVLNHNIETVPRLYRQIRPGADYRRSLALLKATAEMNPKIPTKSGIMLGLGEERDEIRSAMADLRSVGCAMLTIGQYLQPSREHAPLRNFISPETFDMWRMEALAMGFGEVASGPLVRSSYNAAALFEGLLFQEGVRRQAGTQR